MQKLKPLPRQLKYLDWEFGGFIHFGIRTYFKNSFDGDLRPMPPTAFELEHADCEQWVREFKDAGAKYAVFTAKHHDGFCNWQTDTTDYSIKSTSYKNGKGDLVKEFVDACHKYDMAAGIYYSPAQWNNAVISFSDDEDAYNDYFARQLTELLTKYGKIDYLWFDGCGSGGHHFDNQRIIDIIRTNQPDMLVFNMFDPDIRWVGNEIGVTPMPNRSESDKFDDALSVHTENECRVKFAPVMCDFPLRATSWFDCLDNVDTIRSIEELIGIYYMTVGRGGNMLMNIGPDRTGSFPEPDAARLREFGKAIKEIYANRIDFTAPESAGNRVTIRRKERTLVNQVCIQENLTEGESVLGYRIYANDVLVYTGYTIGHKALCVFPPVNTDELTLEITESNGGFKIDSFDAYMVHRM